MHRTPTPALESDLRPLDRAVPGHRARKLFAQHRSTPARRRAFAAACATIALWAGSATARVEIDAEIEGISFRCAAHDISMALKDAVRVSWTCNNGGLYACTVTSGMSYQTNPPRLVFACGAASLPPAGLLLFDSFEPWL